MSRGRAARTRSEQGRAGYGAIDAVEGTGIGSATDAAGVGGRLAAVKLGRLELRDENRRATRRDIRHALRIGQRQLRLRLIFQ